MDCPACGKSAWDSSGFWACNHCGWSEAVDIANTEREDEDVLADDDETGQ